MAQEYNEIEAYLRANRQLLCALEIENDAPLFIKPLGKGEHNENFIFGDARSTRRYVLRVNRVPQPFHETQVAYEYAALRALESSGCTPKPLYCDASPEALGKGVLVESFCAGEELDFDNLREGDLAQVAHLMADVHAVPFDDACPLFRPSDPLQTLFDECVDRFKVYKGTAFEDARYTCWIERFFAATQKKMDACPPAAGQAHIINTETLPSHFLLAHPSESLQPADASCKQGVQMAADESGTCVRCEDANELCGYAGAQGAFVDWERPIIGEVAQDLAFFIAPSTTFWDSNYLFPRENIQAFLDEYWRAVDGRFSKGSFEAHFDAYLAVSVLRSQTWFCKNAARYAQSEGAHTVQRTFDKWDTYTSDEFNEMLLRECF